MLRRLRVDDASRLIELRSRLSPETVRQRFLRDRPNCDPREAEALADQVRRVAFAAVPTRGADGPIVAVGRYHVECLRSTQCPLQVRYAGGGDVLRIQLDISSGTTAHGVAPVREQEMVSRGSPARR